MVIKSTNPFLLKMNERFFSAKNTWKQKSNKKMIHKTRSAMSIGLGMFER
eukprot:TRINITY_DN26340_c0_g1_i1.p2 TRINITY_DN26340_c0_g1~~TRINITY_DN26340_c0_g1_i1.p2  ORF type:complete len:50 (+),score=2.11 TRINITY_DN26340_c0_g1_i1:31-180(+)